MNIHSPDGRRLIILSFSASATQFSEFMSFPGEDGSIGIYPEFML
jgi:hypothetical protein